MVSANAASDGISPLHRACIRGHAPVVEHLLSTALAGSVNVPDMRGRTPLWLVCCIQAYSLPLPSPLELLLEWVKTFLIELLEIAGGRVVLGLWRQFGLWFTWEQMWTNLILRVLVHFRRFVVLSSDKYFLKYVEKRVKCACTKKKPMYLLLVIALYRHVQRAVLKWWKNWWHAGDCFLLVTSSVALPFSMHAKMGTVMLFSFC